MKRIALAAALLLAAAAGSRRRSPGGRARRRSSLRRGHRHRGGNGIGDRHTGPSRDLGRRREPRRHGPRRARRQRGGDARGDRRLAARQRHEPTHPGRLASPRTLEDGTVDGFTAQNTVSATIAVGRAGAAIDAGVEAGANVVWGPTLSSSDAKKLYREALESAVADARERAAVLATAAGRTLGQDRDRRERSRARPSRCSTRPRLSMGSTPIEPGTQETSATVSVTYELR